MRDCSFLAVVDDFPVAVAAYRLSDGLVKLISISSYRRGAGSELFREIERLGPVWCKGLDSAAGFYLKMGMVPLCPIMVGDRPAHVYIKI